MATTELLEFKSAIKYAFAVEFGAIYSESDVPTIGLVFGGPEHATLCHAHVHQTYASDELTIEIIPIIVTAKIEVKEVATNRSVFVVEVNYDAPQLTNFKNTTPSQSRIALIFGFKQGCDYYVTGYDQEPADKYSPILLTGFKIHE